eukprot:2989169-Prymnesium_polylepis.1
MGLLGIAKYWGNIMASFQRALAATCEQSRVPAAVATWTNPASPSRNLLLLQRFLEVPGARRARRCRPVTFSRFHSLGIGLRGVRVARPWGVGRGCKE